LIFNSPGEKRRDVVPAREVDADAVPPGPDGARRLNSKVANGTSNRPDSTMAMIGHQRRGGPWNLIGHSFHRSHAVTVGGQRLPRVPRPGTGPARFDRPTGGTRTGSGRRSAGGPRAPEAGPQPAPDPPRPGPTSGGDQSVPEHEERAEEGHRHD